MKIKVLLITLAVSFFSAFNISAQSLSDLFSGSGNTISNLLEGVFSRSDLSVADLAGEWKSNGPAVCFQSDNLLKKAGGITAAAAIESKLNPYYEQYGLNGAKIVISKDGSFTMTLKKLSLKGTITQVKNEKGVFYFNFTILGSISLGNIKTYVQKTSSSMDIMFDASKLTQLISAIASFTGNNLAKTLGSVLDGYEGVCVGFALDKTGSTSQSGKSSSADSDAIKSGLESLQQLLNKNKK